ncbi:MAG: 16S rRNA (guanine(527)-N(7))-methyltransferase RsmG [Bacillota bacterium]
MEPANRKLLEEGLRAFGLAPTEASVEAVIKHLSLVAEWNERINLTAITAEREMVIKHALDSAAGLQVIQKQSGLKMLDVGTGAGFPGVTWKCLMPEIDLVLLESLQKRCRFLEVVGQEVIEPLTGGAGGYQIIWSRAEDAGQSPLHRERYDVVTARAVAELRILAEYCLPFVKVGGEFLAMKGPGVGEEIAHAKRALNLLGGEVEEAVEVELPEGAGVRSLIRIRKVMATPKSYPRRAGTPAKSPL